MTEKEKNTDTKELIINAANELFAKKGFDGTSIRDIAQQAGVNLAAINYHFGNKDSLYWKVFDHNYEWIHNNILELGKKDTNTIGLVQDVFQFFVESGPAIMNTFKIFLNDNVRADDQDVDTGEAEKFGPPGQEVFLKKIRNDLGEDFSEEAAQWAVKMIFSLLVHFGVVLNTTLMIKKCQLDDEMKPDRIKKALCHSMQAHLDYLKLNPELK